MYRGVVAQVRKTRTGLVLASRSSEDGTHLSARLPRSIGGPVPKGRGVMVTTAGWVLGTGPEGRLKEEKEGHGCGLREDRDLFIERTLFACTPCQQYSVVPANKLPPIGH